MLKHITLAATTILFTTTAIFTTPALAEGCAADFDFVAPQGHEMGDANRSTLKKGLGAAAGGDFDTFMSVAADPYIQHSPG